MVGRQTNGKDLNMSRWLAWIRPVWGLVPLLAGLCLLVTASAAAQTWPRNGDFSETGTPPAGWFLDQEAAPKGQVRVVAGEGGQRVLELLPNTRNTPGPKPLGLGQILPANAFRGREVTVSARLAASGGAQAVLGLVILRKGGEASSIQLRSTATALTSHQDRLAIPDDPAIDGLILFLVAEGTAGAARFAQIRITAGTASADPPSPAAAAGVIDARVRVDTTSVRRRIPRDLFGTNIEVIREANGLWDIANQRLEPAIVALARGMGSTLIRFPGGVWSDAYDWRDGVGPRAQRRIRPTHPGAEETSRNQFGTDEALAFAREVGGTLLITVNAGTGTPEMAAEWVRHVNGDGGRTPRDGRVTVWEIGNELYMKEDMSGGHMSPEKYADRFLAFAAAMRAVDPSIRLAAIGLRNYGRYRFAERDDWNEVVLRKAGHVIDVLAIHNAYAPLVGDGKGHRPDDVYAAMLAAPVLIERNLKDTRRDIERFAPARADRISMGITEWGPLFAVNPASPWIDHVKTLGSALFVASTLRVFMQDPNVSLANFFKLNEPSFMGWIGRAGSAWLPTAPYFAFQMVSRGMESDLLPTQTESPRYNSRTVGFIDRVSDVPYLDAIASQSGDGRIVTVLLVNKHLSAAARTTVSLSGLAGVTALTARTLTGATVDANTGTQLPVIPGLNWARQAAAGPRGRIDRGAPDEIRLDAASLSPATATEVLIPPHSITLLRFEGARR